MQQIQSSEFFKFINDNLDADPSALRLRFHGKDSAFNLDLAITQIECRKKCKKKLKSFLENKDFLFPSVVSAEQASHEAIARFHRSLIGECSSLLDMTAGLGIDVMTASESVKHTVACEMDTAKAEMLKWNATVTGHSSMTVLNTDSIEWLMKSEETFDVVFIDPSRRGSNNSRLYNLHDCEPDILKNLPFICRKCRRLIIKASPLLDITQTLHDIECASAIRAVSINGECKEILIEVDRRNPKPTLLEAINLDETGCYISRLSFFRHDAKGEIAYASQENLSKAIYLYEPDASVMKLSPWIELQAKYPGILKLDKSSHLFISTFPITDFPGRTLKVSEIISGKDVKSLKGGHFNVTTRNYPLKAEELRKKLSIKEGTSKFLYGTRVSRKPVLICAEKI